MFKDLKIKNILPTIICVAAFIWLVWFIFVKTQKKDIKTESSFEPANAPDSAGSNTIEDKMEDPNNLPGLFQIQYLISTKGKKEVFPFTIEKVTEGPIELPNRRSLLDKDAKYKFIDIMPGQKIKVVSLQNLTYTIDHKVFNHDFLITDNDYLIAYTQAKEHFKLAK